MTDSAKKALLALKGIEVDGDSRDGMRASRGLWNAVGVPINDFRDACRYLTSERKCPETYDGLDYSHSVSKTRNLTPEFLAFLAKTAQADPSALVRRYIASGIQRVIAKDRKDILAGLLSHAEDATDFNLPLLYWYALEPLAGEDPKAALELAANGKIPMLLQFTARRIASTSGKEQNELLAAALAKEAEREARRRRRLLILRGMNEGFRGRKDIPPPANWSATSEKLAALNKPEIESQAMSVAIAFGDPKAFAAMRAVVTNPKMRASERLRCPQRPRQRPRQGTRPRLAKARRAIRTCVARRFAGWRTTTTRRRRTCCSPTGRASRRRKFATP